jgi:hypothetical protein
MSEEYRSSIRQFTFGYPRNSYPLADLGHYTGDKEPTLAALADYAFTYLLQHRKLSFELIQKHKIGVGYEDFTQEDVNVPRYGMVMVPVIVNGEIVSYTSRAIESKIGRLCKLKQYTPHEGEGYLTKGQVLYNCDNGFSVARREGRLVLVEDPWSAMKLECVGVLGTTFSSAQYDILIQNWRGTIVILFDNDEGGNTAATKVALTLLQHYPDVRIGHLASGDPDDNVEEARQAIDSAVSVDSFGLQLSQSLK